MQDTPALVRKFWEGTASPEEQQQLLQWLSQHPAKEALQKMYEQDLEEGTKAMPPERSAEILQKLLTQIAPPKTRSLRWIGWAAAAAVAGGVIATTLLRKELKEEKPPIAKAIEARTIDTLRNDGATAETITLQDRSTVLLDPQSFIVLRQPFDSTDRRIYLKGRARFNVTKDAERPFSVQAGAVTTRVLGTEFIINAKDPKHVTVQLLSGRVLVEGKTKMLLTPGQTYTENKKEQAGPLIFNETPLRTVFQRIGHRYHIQIDFDANEIRELRFTGSFQDTDSLTMMLSVICNMNGLSYRQEGSRIVIQTTR